MIRRGLTLVAALSVATATVLGIQGPVPPPKEMKQIAFMRGTWTADLTAYDGGKAFGKATSTMRTVPSLNGMYLETRGDTKMQGMDMKGLQMTTYDPEAKQFVAYWYDSVSPGALELRGTLKGKSLVLTSKPTKVPGMPTETAFRFTNIVQSPKKILFRLEMNPGNGWSKMLEGLMTKKP